MGRLDGQVAIVTGGSRGFGRATSLRLAAEGADVVVAYRAAEREAQEVIRGIEQRGRRALLVQADMAQPADCDKLARLALEGFGQVDLLVNNAGVMDARPLLEQGAADWESMIQVNVMGVTRLTAAVLPSMIARRRGCIVNLASQLGHVGAANFAVYSGTKAWILAFGKSLAREVGQQGIRVNTVCPGGIVTDMNRAIYPPARQAERAKELPLGRMGAPDDVAAAVAYLASADAGFVTGQCLDVNGGSIMV